NYGYFWGFDNVGSSPFSSNDTYRGTAGFSEPETRAVKWLCEQKRFQYTMNYHSFGNDIIYPWGYIGSLLTPDSAQFDACAAFITNGVPYRYGTGDQTVGYLTNGDSDDWMYGEQTTKNKILSFTPEIGTQEHGFYPALADIIPDCQNNLVTNLKVAELLLPFAAINTTDERIITSNSGWLHYNLQRLGVRDTTYTVGFRSLDSRLTITGAAHSHGTFSMLQVQSDSFAYTIASGTPNGQMLSYERQWSNGYYTLTDTVSFYYGRYYNNIIPATDTLLPWTTSDWSTCHSIYHTAPASLGSSASPCDNYTDGTYATLTLQNTIDLTHTRRAYLYYWTRFGIEANYDYAAVMAAPASTSGWQPLCGRYTKAGTTSQLADEPIYDGQQRGWVQEEIDLGDWLGQTITLQFLMAADAGVNYAGMYIDDVNIIAIRDSSTQVNNAGIATGGMTIAPNPATATTTVTFSRLPQGITINLWLTDRLGRMVYTGTASGSQATIPTGTLPDGTYYLKAQAGNEVLPVERIVVLH
ncbi:MAG: T9SS C-terminal target domain-containing protein, partial [Chitinophagia bacterium]|nr:T9SS C-terminal target domain-containing protein [Chitinophagia bacterium]